MQWQMQHCSVDGGITVIPSSSRGAGGLPREDLVDLFIKGQGGQFASCICNC